MAVRIAVGVALIALLGFAGAEGVVPGAAPRVHAGRVRGGVPHHRGGSGRPSQHGHHLHYCGYPDCDAETSGSDGSVQLGPHWAMWHDYAVGSSLFLVAAWALCACWLVFLLGYVAARVVGFRRC